MIGYLDGKPGWVWSCEMPSVVKFIRARVIIGVDFPMLIADENPCHAVAGKALLVCFVGECRRYVLFTGKPTCNWYTKPANIGFGK